MFYTLYLFSQCIQCLLLCLHFLPLLLYHSSGSKRHGDTEIKHLDVALLVNQNILWLEVSLDGTLQMHLINSPRHLSTLTQDLLAAHLLKV